MKDRDVGRSYDTPIEIYDLKCEKMMIFQISQIEKPIHCIYLIMTQKIIVILINLNEFMARSYLVLIPEYFCSISAATF